MTSLAAATGYSRNPASPERQHFEESAVPTRDRQYDVFILNLGDGDNRFHPDWITAMHTALDEVEKASDARALVTAETGKFLSNGLDLDWLGAHTARSLGSRSRRWT